VPGQQRGILIGSGLIVLGLLLLVAQFYGGLVDALIPLVMGGGFILAYALRRQYGWLIPGGLLTGVGVSGLLEYLLGPPSDLSALGLGVGFLLIYLIDRLYRGATSRWPLVPGAVLTLLSLAENLPQFEAWLTIGWPALLILLGLLLLIRTFRGGSNSPFLRT